MNYISFSVWWSNVFSLYHKPYASRFQSNNSEEKQQLKYMCIGIKIWGRDYYVTHIL